MGLAFCLPAAAQDVTTGAVSLTWVKPTENVDGTPFDDFGEYGVYWREVGATTWTKERSTVETKDISGLTRGKTYEFYVTAVDLVGNESDPSAIVSAFIPLLIDIVAPTPIPVVNCRKILTLADGTEVTISCD